MAGAPPEAYPVTPDGRYFVVKGRLWRCTNPALSPEAKARLTKQLMDARRLIAFIKREGRSDTELMAARAKIDAAKIELGERAAVWWDDGAPDFNRRMRANLAAAGEGKMQVVGGRAYSRGVAMPPAGLLGWGNQRDVPGRGPLDDHRATNGRASPLRLPLAGRGLSRSSARL